MITASLIAFLGTAVIVVVTPGLDTAFVLRTAAVGGRRAGVQAALGIGLGCLCWGAAASFGLGALIHSSPAAFAALKLVGAVYLLWLGLRMLMRPRADLAGEALAKIGADNAAYASMRRGFSTNVLNPKIGLFYVTLLPQFVPAGVATGWYAFGLALMHVTLAVSWFTILATMTASAAHLLRKPSVMPFLDRITGGVFVAFGLHLALV
jgi:threonine/homoserine/homoserine lactone efflux protein